MLDSSYYARGGNGDERGEERVAACQQDEGAEKEREREREREAQKEVVWTLFLLDRMFARPRVASPTVPGGLYAVPMLRGGPGHPGMGSGSGSGSGGEGGAGGVVASSPGQIWEVAGLQVPMMRIWELVMGYVSESAGGHGDVEEAGHPVWHPKSKRTRVKTALLEFEIRECLLGCECW